MTRTTALVHHGLDALVVVLAVAAEIEIFAADVPGPKAVLAPVVLLWTLPLLFRRRFPFLAPLVVMAAVAGESFLPDHPPSRSLVTFVAMIVTVWALAAYNDQRHALAGLVLVLVTIVVAHDPANGVGDFVAGAVIFIAAWLGGRVLRGRTKQAARLEERTVRLEREREAQARAADVRRSWRCAGCSACCARTTRRRRSPRSRPLRA